jgi:homoserine kinase
MNLRHDLPDKLSFEDRIDELSRVALLVLLLATLACIA